MKHEKSSAEKLSVGCQSLTHSLAKGVFIVMTATMLSLITATALADTAFPVSENSMIPSSSESYLKRMSARMGRAGASYEMQKWGRKAIEYWENQGLQRLDRHMRLEIENTIMWDQALANTQQRLFSREGRTADPIRQQQFGLMITELQRRREQIHLFSIELQQRRKLIPHWQSLLEANNLSHAMEQEIRDTELLLQSTPARERPLWLSRSPEALWEAMQDSDPNQEVR